MCYITVDGNPEYAIEISTFDPRQLIAFSYFCYDESGLPIIYGDIRINIIFLNMFCQISTLVNIIDLNVMQKQIRITSKKISTSKE